MAQSASRRATLTLSLGTSHAEGALLWSRLRAPDDPLQRPQRRRASCAGRPGPGRTGYVGLKGRLVRACAAKHAVESSRLTHHEQSSLTTCDVGIAVRLEQDATSPYLPPGGTFATSHRHSHPQRRLRDARSGTRGGPATAHNPPASHAGAGCERSGARERRPVRPS